MPKSNPHQVYGTETWRTYELDEIISVEDWDLTLFTCTYGGTNRIVIRCGLVENPPEKEV